MARVFIGIGTNVGDRHAHVKLAERSLAALPGTQLIAMSRVYETAPVGPVSQGDFLNAVAELDTQLPPTDLLEHLADIEAQAGRTPEAQRQKWGPRTLDLDILLYDDAVIDNEQLVVPHPRMHERTFVLEPLAELAPNAMHPVLRKTVAELLAALKS